MAESSINASKYSRKYGIPYLSIHEVYLNPKIEELLPLNLNLKKLNSQKFKLLSTKTIGAHIAITTPMLCDTV